MKKAALILIIAGVLFAKYTLTITVETETIKEAGKVEEIVLGKLKEYDPKISIETTTVQVNTIQWDSLLILDTLSQFQPIYPHGMKITPNGNVLLGN